MHQIRPVAPSDIDLICRHRREMSREAGRAAEAIAAMDVTFRSWLKPRLADGRYFGFIAEESTGNEQPQAIGGVGLMELGMPPHPTHPLEDRRGYILNLFVEPTHRGLGIARDLMQLGEKTLIERGMNYLVLHATDLGRPLYEKLGWVTGREMMKMLPPRLPTNTQP